MDILQVSQHTDGTSPRLWVAQPNFRGTFGIFSLCLSTLLICVWNAVHLDVPMHRFSAKRKLLVAVAWMFVAIFGPELLLFIAFNQRLSARKVLRLASQRFSTADSGTSARSDDKFSNIDEDIKETSIRIETEASALSTSADDDIKIQRKHPFTIVHGFYASMGGFVFDLRDEDSNEPASPRFLPPGQTRMCITASGVQFLLRHDPALLPDLSELSILDRSSGGSVGKALLLAQLAWFCANCVTRLAQDLPLSLLEIGTVAHGLCGMITYALWWHKPQGIADPTPIRGRRAREACALMAVCSMKQQYLSGGIYSIHLPAELDYLTTLPRDSEKGDDERLVLQHSLSEEISDEYVSLVPEEQGLGEVGLTPKRYVSPGVLQETSIAIKARILYRIRRDDIPWHSRRREPDEPIKLGPLDVNRWLLASNAMKRYGVDPQILAAEISSQQPYVMPKSSMQASSDTKARTFAGIVSTNIATITLTVAFGLPHFLGWNVDFPTLTERTLWRIATVTVTSWGIGMAFCAAVAILVRWWFGKRPWDRRGEALFVACGSAIYNMASAYLLIESIVQLFYLPPAAYNLPSWSNYWPHFG